MTRSTTKKATAPAKQETKQNRDDGLRQAYSEATTSLRAQHRVEFQQLYVAAAKKRGIDYTPPPTAEEKAQQQIAALVAQFGPGVLKDVPLGEPTIGASIDDEHDPEQDAQSAGVIPS